MSIGLHRGLAFATAVLFFISSLFPVVGAFVHDKQSWPKWWGVLDVGLAFVLAAMVLVIQAMARDRVSQQAKDVTYRMYRVLIHGIFAGLIVFFVAGDRILWNQCLTGLAWRAWLCLYTLPCWVVEFRTNVSGP